MTTTPKFPNPKATAAMKQRSVVVITLELSVPVAREVKAALSSYGTDHPTDLVYQQLGLALRAASRL